MTGIRHARGSGLAEALPGKAFGTLGKLALARARRESPKPRAHPLLRREHFC